MNNSAVITIRACIHDAAWLYERLAYASSGDVLILQNDAVMALHSPISLASFLAKAESNNITVFAVREDCQLLGVQNCYAGIRLLEQAELLSLFCQHAKHVAW